MAVTDQHGLRDVVPARREAAQGLRYDIRLGAAHLVLGRPGEEVEAVGKAEVLQHHRGQRLGLRGRERKRDGRTAELTEQIGDPWIDAAVQRTVREVVRPVGVERVLRLLERHALTVAE